MINLKFLKIFQPYLCNDMIRLGNDYDGGYLVNRRDVLESTNLINLGVGGDGSFERAFTEINDCPVVAFDGTIDASQEFITQYYIDHRQFINKNVGNNLNEVPFSSILTEPNSFLKCDIEGGEYEILDDIINRSKLLRGMVIEFHTVGSNEDHFNDLINFIGKVDLKLIHVHVNNYGFLVRDTWYTPQFIELSFSAADNLIYDKNIELPHRLDNPNCPEREEFKIIF